MEEITEIIPDEDIQATTPASTPCVPVKFNKQIKNLTIEEAAVLSQKGMKYDALAQDYERLKNFAKSDKISVSAFLDTIENARTNKRKQELVDSCGGNEEMAEHILSLEGNSAEVLTGQAELKEYFPSLNIEDLPESVKENAKKNNTSLLDEYLRFEARRIQNERKDELKRQQNAQSTVGSLRDTGDGNISPLQLEFLKGLWG